jgi:hypothetical protein
MGDGDGDGVDVVMGGMLYLCYEDAQGKLIHS